MDHDLASRRQELLDKHDALAAGDGRSTMASAELCKVADGLEAVAREAESRGDRSVETGRTWRWAGMAYHDANPLRDETIALRAVAAYEQCERFIDPTEDAIDAIKTDYCMARALIDLADGADGSVAQDAVDRLNRARTAARGSAPEFLPSIEEALVAAEQLAALRARTDRLDDRIQRLSLESAGSADAAEDELSADDMKGLFAILQQQVDQEPDPQRRESVSGIMESLSQLVANAGTDRSLSDMAIERERLDKLMEQMKPLLRRQSDE